MAQSESTALVRSAAQIEMKPPSRISSRAALSALAALSLCSVLLEPKHGLILTLELLYHLTTNLPIGAVTRWQLLS